MVLWLVVVVLRLEVVESVEEVVERLEVVENVEVEDKVLEVVESVEVVVVVVVVVCPIISNKLSIVIFLFTPPWLISKKLLGCGVTRANSGKFTDNFYSPFLPLSHSIVVMVVAPSS